MLTCFANKVEFVYPPLTDEDGPREEKSGLPAAWENLPFLALPDGVHRSGTSQHSPRSCGRARCATSMPYRRQEAHRDDCRGGPLLLHTAASAEPAATDRPPLRRFLLSSGPRVGAHLRQLFVLHLCRCACTRTRQLTDSFVCPLVVARQLRSLHAHAGPEDCMCTYERRTIPTSHV